MPISNCPIFSVDVSKCLEELYDKPYKPKNDIISVREKMYVKGHFTSAYICFSLQINRYSLNY